VIESNELLSMMVFLAVFLVTAGGGFFIISRVYGDHRRAIARLRDLSTAGKASALTPSFAEIALAAVPKVGQTLMPSNRERLSRLKARMTQAGIYGPNALSIFLGAQLFLAALLPATAGLFPYLLGLLSWQKALAVGSVAAAVGMLAPSFWVDYQRNQRKSELRQAVPDALDMLVLCLEAGLSLPAALQRVTGELVFAHPALARELNIVQREIQLGLGVGDALKKFGDRCDLEEVRNLATVIIQSERYGASSVKALRLHSDSCRLERQQRAEERAQKAAVKILFPTLLCIFPAIFIVILGPAAYQIANLFSHMK
jgi:tight adherence protein C